MRIFNLLLLFILFSSIGSAQHKIIKEKNLPPKVFYEESKKNENAVIFDTREKVHFDKSTIPHAIWVGKKTQLYKSLVGVPLNTPIYVYCEYGKQRAKEVISILSKKGYNNVFHLKGGFESYQKCNLPIETK